MEIGSRNNDVVQRGLFLSVAGVGDRGVFADARATVSDVIRGLGGSDDDVLVVHRTGNALASSAVLGMADIRSGDIVTVDTEVETDNLAVEIGPVTLSVLTGAKQGEQFVLPTARAGSDERPTTTS